MSFVIETDCIKLLVNIGMRLEKSRGEAHSKYKFIFRMMLGGAMGMEVGCPVHSMSYPQLKSEHYNLDTKRVDCFETSHWLATFGSMTT
jgi:hypothetical protein